VAVPSVLGSRLLLNVRKQYLQEHVTSFCHVVSSRLELTFEMAPLESKSDVYV
jgi:hypothetical protein